MSRSRAKFLVVTAVLVVAFGAASVVYFVDRAVHAGDGPTHVFDLPGDAPLTDEQAIEFGRRALTLNGRMTPTMVLEPIREGQVANFGDDRSHCSVSWLDESKGRWHASLHRKPDKVVVVTHRGK
jgi:hypothetical protein